IIIQMQTVDICLRGKYFLNATTVVQLSKKFILESVKNSKMYPSDCKFQNFTKNESSQIFIVDGDCLETALLFKQHYNVNPIVLIMASRSHPGGNISFYGIE